MLKVATYLLSLSLYSTFRSFTYETSFSCTTICFPRSHIHQVRITLHFNTVVLQFVTLEPRGREKDHFLSVIYFNSYLIYISPLSMTLYATLSRVWNKNHDSFARYILTYESFIYLVWFSSFPVSIGHLIVTFPKKHTLLILCHT